jgi:hypothetical protein
VVKHLLASTAQCPEFKPQYTEQQQQTVLKPDSSYWKRLKIQGIINKDTYNPNYLGGSDQEDRGSKPA